jgi:hypothetical protein
MYTIFMFPFDLMFGFAAAEQIACQGGGGE